MTQTVDAIYEDGVLRPLQSLCGIRDRCRVRLTVETIPDGKHPLATCVGSLPDEDAQEMRRLIEDEFEQVDARDW